MDSAEREEYAGARSIGNREAEEAGGAESLEKVLDRENLNGACKRVKANKGAPGIDGYIFSLTRLQTKDSHRPDTTVSLTGTSPCTYAIEPPCTERHARWCERSVTQLMGGLLLD